MQKDVIKATITHEIEVTPEQVAELFANMDNIKQAKFFNRCREVAKEEGWSFDSQMLSVVKPNTPLTSQGRSVMRAIANAIEYYQDEVNKYLTFGFEAYLKAHIDWSTDTFGEGSRTEGIIKHIESELEEIREDPSNPIEWVDVIILAIDGATREGATPRDVIKALIDKQEINFKRAYEQTPPDEPSFHIKNDDT